MNTKVPYKIENPDFRCALPNAYGLEAEVAVSDPESGYKVSRKSTLRFRTDQIGGYPMSVAVRLDSTREHWLTKDDLAEVIIEFHGDFEADNLVQFLQHAGRMSTVIYGNRTSDENIEEGFDALR